MTGPKTGGAAGLIADVVRTHSGLDLPVRLRAWDGSEAGPANAPVLIAKTPRAVARMLWRPGELGLARAYISGDLEVEGDLTDGLRRVWTAVRSKPHNSRTPSVPLIPQIWIALAALRAAARLDLLRSPWPPPAPPDCELRLSGRLHSRARDRAVIAGHYDVTAAFYQLIMDSSMAYSCAYWTSDRPGYTLADAQRDKLEMICTKLGLAHGQRLLDMGCGWGSLTVHAARDHRATVTGVTLSGEQGGYVRERIRGLGLGERAEVKIQDYRDPLEGRYDAAASIEMGEHVGAANYPRFCRSLFRRLRPGGRLLIQQMSRGARAPGGGPFIESYITPDMTMRPVGETIALVEKAGFEVIGVQAMREHYVRTIRAWLDNFERHLPEVEKLLTPEQVRVWRLYLAGGALAFEEGRMGVDQILAVRPER
ncbi:MAG: cyclopropane-fatty-acyl-phospholipid synthase family protein [Streptosporangiaceae bacterium]